MYYLYKLRFSLFETFLYDNENIIADSTLLSCIINVLLIYS